MRGFWRPLAAILADVIVDCGRGLKALFLPMICPSFGRKCNRSDGISFTPVVPIQAFLPYFGNTLNY
jgi:hypothetical protein